MIFLVSYPFKGGTTIAIEAESEEQAKTKFQRSYPHITITKIEKQNVASLIHVSLGGGATDTTDFDKWLQTVLVRISIEAKEEDDAKVQADYLSWTEERLTHELGNLCVGYSLYKDATDSRYSTIFRMTFPIPPSEVVRPEFLSRFKKPIEWVTLKDGKMELAATDYIKYLLCNGFRVGINNPKENINGNQAV